MCRKGIGDSSDRRWAWVDFPVPGVPVIIITGDCLDPDEDIERGIEVAQVQMISIVEFLFQSKKMVRRSAG